MARVGLNHPGVYNFWDVQDHPHDALVRDTWRHKQINTVNLSDLRNTQSTGWTTGFSESSLQLVAANMIGLPRTVAELSERRKRAIINAYRRIDVQGMNGVRAKELAAALQRFSSLPPQDQSSLVGAILAHSGKGAAGEVSLANFVEYYEGVSREIRRDRDFEDLIHQQWGFAEVEDILDDMKNKFSILGLAYTFQKSPSAGEPSEYTPRSFQTAISNVGIRYQTSDVDRIFKAFSPVGNKKVSTLELTQHLTSAAKPSTPEGPLCGAAREPNVAPFETQAYSSRIMSSPLALQTGTRSHQPRRGVGGAKFPPPETAPPERQPALLPDDEPSANTFPEEPDVAPLAGREGRRQREQKRKREQSSKFPPTETAPPETLPVGIDDAVGESNSYSSFGGIADEPDNAPQEGQNRLRQSSGWPSTASAPAFGQPFKPPTMSRHGLHPGAQLPPVETAPPEFSPTVVDADSETQDIGTFVQEPSSAPAEGSGNQIGVAGSARPPAAAKYWKRAGGSNPFPPTETAPPEAPPTELDTTVMDN